MRQCPPEDKTLMAQAINIIIDYFLVIIRKSSEPFRFLLYLQPLANYWRKPISTLIDCDIPLNKYPMRSGRRSKQSKVICPGSQHVGSSGARTHNLPFMSCAVPPDHTCPHKKGQNLNWKLPSQFELEK